MFAIMKATALLPIIMLAAISCGTAKNQNFKSESEDEVVNIGYQKAMKKDVNGAVHRIKIKDEGMSFTNIYEYLKGSVAGLEVEGETSGRPTIRIRGINSITGPNDPLIIVDGVYESVEGLSGINPRDVDTVDVLKDASMTASYGSRGSGGVIIITLKKGGKD